MTAFNQELIQTIASQLEVTPRQVEQVLTLLAEGNTVPFIARYRKEQTGALVEEKIRAIHKEYEYQKQLQERKEDVLRLIAEKGKLTLELKEKILKAEKLAEVEDLYRPYREKRKTRATEAIRKGLEPLASYLLSFPKEASILDEAAKYVNAEHEVYTIEDALQGAKDIIAEMVSDDPDVRQYVKRMFIEEGVWTSKIRDGAHDERKVYLNYYDYCEPVRSIVSHRILAMNRGEKEKVLRITIEEPVDQIIEWLHKRYIQCAESPATVYVIEAIEDGYKRLIKPSVEREIRSELKETAEEQAIQVFAANLRQLLLQPPMKGQVVLGVDPAYRTGCKLAVVDETGKLLHIDVIYPHEKYKGEVVQPERIQEAKGIVKQIVEHYGVRLIAIGNGTASRETESFIADVIREFRLDVHYVIVNEAGASVYSASELAKEEFPNLNVEERSAISIARRLQDPLSELVKIDPKSIGVGQYQHDVNQTKLSESLDFVVETTVNRVGVNLNSASETLLKYVSGCNTRVAKNIVAYRNANGKFTNRKQLLNVPHLGPKVYEQAVGFLRILDGDEPLDRTEIHPENYDNARKILDVLGFTTNDLGTERLQEAIQTCDRTHLMHITGLGEHTLNDILNAFVSPLRDPRDEFPQPLLKKGVLDLEDLEIGMELQGTVRNVVDFGAFVDCGVTEDGLIHISRMSRQYVKHPLDILQVGDIVTVYVESIDLERRRLGLSLIPPHPQK